MNAPSLPVKVYGLPDIRFLSLDEWDERRPVALVTSGPAWAAVREDLRLQMAWRGSPRQATLSHWQEMLAGLQGEVVYAVGGGLAADAAKFLAAQRNLPLVCIPTALSVDAFFTWASGVREEGCVRYIETRPPDLLLVDLDVIATAPPSPSGCRYLRCALHCHRVVGLALRRGAGPEPTRDGLRGVGCGRRAGDSAGSAGLRRSGRRRRPRRPALPDPVPGAGGAALQPGGPFPPGGGERALLRLRRGGGNGAGDGPMPNWSGRASC
jgi:hypothetical protein